MNNNDFDTDSQYKEQLFKELLEIVKELGWKVAFPIGDDDDAVPGMIIGTEEYVTDVTEAVDEFERYDD